MKKIMKIRIPALFLCLCIVLSLLTVTAKASPKSYVALGDSISTGYGLPQGAENFTELLADSSFTLYNQAADGETTSTLLAKLQDPSGEALAAVQNAGLITLTIGGNDLMNALYDYLAAQYNATYSASLNGEDIKEALVDSNSEIRGKVLLIAGFVIKNFPSSEEATSALAAFTTNFKSIIGILRGSNPHATLIVTTQYNPYSHIQNDSVSEIVSAFDTGVSILNSVIRTGATNGNYTVADVYTAFKDSQLNPCNAYFKGQNDFNLDFHPNTDGHKLIAETIKELGIMNPIGVTASCDTYDRNGFDPVTYTLSHPDSVRFTELKAGDQTLTQGTDYTISGDVITLKDSYLKQQEEGTTLNLSFCFNTGEPATASLKIPKTYKITINSDPVNGGYFFANGYSNGESVYYVTQGKEVELSAEAYNGYQFTAWKKDDGELISKTFYTFTPTEDCTLTMVYELIPASLGISPSELDFGVLDPPYTQPEARIVTITNTGETLLGLFQPESEHYEIGELSIYLL